MKDNGAIILGGHIQALGIIRILGRIGVKCGIIDKTRKNIARHSKYCSYFAKVSDNDLLSFLISLGKENRFIKWVIFPTNDFHVRLLSMNKLLLEEYFIVGTDNWEVISNFYNKCLTYRLIEKIGISYPKTWFPLSEEDLSFINVDFPCILKPAVMHDFYRRVKKKVFICKDYNDLLEQYRKALQYIPAQEVIIQEIIPGSSNNQVSACFLFLHGKTYVSLSAFRMRQHPVDFGNATTYAETMEIPEILKYAETILNKCNYNGLCEVEFKKDSRDGSYKFLEVNTRTWKWHAIANKAGTPFIETYFNYLNGVSIEPVIGFKKASFVHFVTDFPIRIKLLLKGNNYWNRLIQPTEHAVWSKDDKKPWIFEKLYLFNLIVAR